ncbi:hypothetical protein [Halalkalibaculum sp. DA384]|uniref:hypothetical protein n=1 Tax=Halalkalibaculum sp. DA384 TaxID=3373606 RepID=UPI003754816B
MFHKKLLVGCVVIISMSGITQPAFSQDRENSWFRGNLHTHSFWNGGRDFPENIAKWYKDNGYDFISFTEHNTIQKGTKWIPLPQGHSTIERYRKNFGNDWVQIKHANDDIDKGDLPRFIEGSKPYIQVRVKPLSEYRTLFEEAGEFLLMNGEEITDQHGVHVLANNVDEVIPTVGGSSNERERMLRKIVSMVDTYRKRGESNVYPILAHPNYNWNITAEMIMNTQNLRFFEVYNGVPEANNEGDTIRPSTDRIWDIVLSFRLGKMDVPLIYGIATDDAHDYDGGIDGRNVGPGKGWVMVRSKELTSESIMNSLKEGDFYSTTGVILKDIQFDGESICIEIEPEEGVSYSTKYIGTRDGFKLKSKPRLDSDGEKISNATRVYSKQIGKVLKKSENIRSCYKYLDEELYVRVVIVSTANQIDPFTREVIGIQKAWVQPVIPGKS